MYQVLDRLLSAETTVDSWYDDGCIIAGEILSEFTHTDWEELTNNVQKKSVEWQKKLAYCLDSTCNEYELSILLSLLSTEDEELFEICIDTLRSFTTMESKIMILENPRIIERVNELLSTVSLPVKKVLEDFLTKIQS
ncbi:hypothetical protein [Tumebacillus flagellatus]|uniref:Immunity protein 30 domain-containing protein n=1 Tax=Tumebacillus flagellatus TaxID=1157490 RepID=A0A074LQQ9_9BACL|nr:hypothetical protein [Tumebacillus flagellatus]KEO84471.1 hypothetical protein EL26_05065 [Tumebacillus flagellatus]